MRNGFVLEPMGALKGLVEPVKRKRTHIAVCHYEKQGALARKKELLQRERKKHQAVRSNLYQTQKQQKLENESI